MNCEIIYHLRMNLHTNKVRNFNATTTKKNDQN